MVDDQEPSGLGGIPDDPTADDDRKTPPEWFASLSENARAGLLADPRGPVPSDLIAEITHASVLVSGGYWPDTHVGPDGFYLPGEFQDYLERPARDPVDRSAEPSA